jgi:sulfur carrier protein ThiS
MGTEPLRPMEDLPLSASRSFPVELELAQGRSVEPRSLAFPLGSLVRDAVRALGETPEGCAVLWEGRPLPLDEPLRPGMRLTVVPTFSGG